MQHSEKQYYKSVIRALGNEKEQLESKLNDIENILEECEGTQHISISIKARIMEVIHE